MNIRILLSPFNFYMMIISLLTSSYAYSDDVNISFTGSIAYGSCQIAVPDQLVDLGSASTMNFNSVGDMSVQKKFYIRLNCPIGSPSKASVTFEGQHDMIDPSLLAISSDAVKGIAIRLEDSLGQKLPLGSASEINNISQGEIAIPFNVRYQSTSERALISPGVADSFVSFAITYQ